MVQFDAHNEEAELSAATQYAEEIISAGAVSDVDELVMHLATLCDAVSDLIRLREDMRQLTEGHRIILPVSKKHAEGMMVIGQAFLEPAQRSDEEREAR